MLRVRNLRKYYGEFLAVKDVSLDVAPGEVVGLLGPNGAGKSTTMKIVTGFLPSSGGEVSVDGYDVTRFPVEVRRRIGYLAEHTPLYTDMRVREFLSYRARIKGVPRRQVPARVDEVIERAWLKDRPRQVIGTLSKGYRQRVGLADAMVGDPRLLILDEPTIGLDPAQIRAVRDLVRELAERHTIVLSTHILAEVEQVCSRVVIIARGETVADDTVQGLQERFDDHMIEVVMEADETTDTVREALRGAGGVVGVTPTPGDPKSTLQGFRVEFAPDADPQEVAKALSRTAAKREWALVRLASQRPSLESIFVRLTQPRVTETSTETSAEASAGTSAGASAEASAGESAA